MDWDQIEPKWAAMTRRVRADWTTHRADIKTPLTRRIARPELAPAAERQTATVPDARPKMSVE